MAVEAVRCRDGCGRVVVDEDEAAARGWLFLDIAKGWRCPDCVAALERVARGVIVESPRACSRCGWTLPEQYGGYVGPCPQCSGQALPPSEGASDAAR